MPTIERFEDIKAWQKSRKLVKTIYRLTAKTKFNRDFGLREQIRRAAISIMSNIAEGFERESQKDCVVFLNYARGSCGELRTQIHIGMEIGYIKRQKGEQWKKEAQYISSMLSSLIKTKKRFIEENK